ncbi:tRNA pseudouridine(55) synthase TruB [Sediminitomix flava]|nr:tRNA pseudouridine(55) synthase TruB [Sediminitomix flava]
MENKVFDFVAGEVLLLDKPYEWTSFDVVKKIRNTIRIKKVGHAGTLDPLATGLLIVCTGKKTKQIDLIQATEKEYVGELVLGKTTPSVDLETEIDSETDISHLTEQEIIDALEQFRGEIEQVPPAHSAVKVDGKRAYKSAREGKEVKLKSRNVVIKELEIINMDLPVIQFRMVCSKGTYVRSFVRDYGKSLGVGAYMSALKRTRIGEFLVSDAYSVQDFVDLVHKQRENDIKEEK